MNKLFTNLKSYAILGSLGALSLTTQAQSTNVFDDVIASSADHTILETAILTANLDNTLRTASGLTVFAPTDAAFTALLGEMGISANDLLADPDLDQILLYHVLGVEVLSTDLSNGTFATTLNGDSAFVSVLSSGAYVDQAMVTTPNLTVDNGTVHVTNDVMLPQNSLIDVAVSNGFSILSQAIIAAELAPAIVDPMSDLTVFAPTDSAFIQVLAELGITANDLLADPELDQILLYHVLGSEVMSTDLSDGVFASTLQGDSTFVSLLPSGVYLDQAMVTATDVDADNGVVHILNDVVFPQNSIVDVAITNGFSTLTQAVVTAELAPALIDPMSNLTVFAPTNDAFDDLAVTLGTDIDGILALPNLQDVLLYHVLGDTVSSTQISNGTVNALNGEQLTLSVDMGNVMVNTSNVTLADVGADNGIVHVVDAVLLPITTSLEEVDAISINTYPNPATNFIRIDGLGDQLTFVTMYDLNGKMVLENQVVSTSTDIDVSDLQNGVYLLKATSGNEMFSLKVQINGK